MRIEVSSGKGGDGIISFRREKCVPRGGPDGGDGGRGGSVYFVADSMQSHLGHLNKMHYRAEHGGSGEGGNRKGRDGKDINLYVPLNTQVWVQTEEEDYDLEGMIKVENPAKWLIQETTDENGQAQSR